MLGCGWEQQKHRHMLSPNSSAVCDGVRWRGGASSWERCLKPFKLKLSGFTCQTSKELNFTMFPTEVSAIGRPKVERSFQTILSAKRCIWLSGSCITHNLKDIISSPTYFIFSKCSGISVGVNWRYSPEIPIEKDLSFSWGKFHQLKMHFYLYIHWWYSLQCWSNMSCTLKTSFQIKDMHQEIESIFNGSRKKYWYVMGWLMFGSYFV